jgi:hypothetical protein
MLKRYCLTDVGNPSTHLCPFASESQCFLHDPAGYGVQAGLGVPKAIEDFHLLVS